MNEWKSTLVVGLLGLLITNSLTFYLATKSAELEFLRIDKASRERSHVLLMDITSITTSLYRECMNLERKLNNYPQHVDEQAFIEFKQSTFNLCDDRPLASEHLDENDSDLANMKLVLQERLGMLQTANLAVTDLLNQYEKLQHE